MSGLAAAVRIDGFDVALSGGAPLVLIAGPCVLEDGDAACAIARALADSARAAGLGFVFKASYDKANRTRLDAPRGPGIDRGLALLERVRREVGVPVLTDVHAPDEAARAGAVVDVVQVPALLSRQTDLLLAAGRTGRPVLIKKGQFMAAPDAAHAAAKVRAGGGRPLLCERGTTFGAGDVVADLRNLVALGAVAPVVFDASHTARPDRALVPALARAAAGAGVAGLFLEVHPDPDAAPSDGATSLRLADAPALIAQVAAIDRIAKRLDEAPTRAPAGT